MPGQDHLRRDVPHSLLAQMGSHVVVGRVPVVEAGLLRQPPICVEAVKIEVQELVDQHAASDRLELTPVDFPEQLPTSPTGLRCSSESPPGELLSAPADRVPTDVDLQVPAAPAIGVNAFGLGGHRDLRENRLVLTRFSRSNSSVKHLNQQVR